MDEITKVKQELERTKTELGILYEVSSAMRRTLQLEEILYIILTGVTSHSGLGFNRAMLFLVNNKEAIIEGKMGIGPDNAESAGGIWKQIEQNKLGLDDLINAYKFSNSVLETGFNQQVRNIRVPLKENTGGLLALCALEGMPIQLNKETIKKFSNDPIVQMMNNDELVAVPFKAKDKVSGIILADNFVNREPITKDDVRLLTMLANQAGLAIENSQLYEKAITRAHTDSLTEIWNHGYFQFLFQAELDKAKAANEPLSLIMIDIDDFKVYNDMLGHQAGDNILKDLAKLIKNQSRKMDNVCRYGGEEFTIILPICDKNEAFLISMKN
ncbi:MAG: sensor domain-containing diguanylate cyclase [Candidatus Omnitrophica bacterium]|nr:sensor domain-containing diguanylate cyclase [Candidatus Omnitrophota bacterium]